MPQRAKWLSATAGKNGSHFFAAEQPSFALEDDSTASGKRGCPVFRARSQLGGGL
jgi:hypothetical protein